MWLNEGDGYISYVLRRDLVTWLLRENLANTYEV